ncbi:MAG: FtsW/RodA/SpoVE family cell cycle protein [Bacteroidaceae bacterium]|nr:FtsW/RodA/SpoVE family cell cycle protein [Bacteroidaceae bacterium]
MDLIRRLFKGDKVVWIVFLFLCLISIVEVFSASGILTYKTGDYWGPIAQHARYMLLGVAAVMVVHKLPCKWFRFVPALLWPSSFVLLILAMFWGEKVNDAGRWLSFMGWTIQPSEFAKLALVSSIALILSKTQEEEGTSRNTFKYILMVSLPLCLLIAPENFSTAAMLLGITILMMYVGRVPFRQWGRMVGFGMLLVGFLGIVAWKIPNDVLDKVPMMHRVTTWKNRVVDFMDDKKVAPAEYDIFNEDAQVGHARIAIATTPIWGKGPGNSVERDFLSQAFSDFIYAIVIEELGLLGGGFLAFLYIILLLRAGRIAQRSEKKYYSFLVMGLALLLVSQALVNMMVAVGLFPVTGQPLPLISKGGTSTVITCLYIGMILGISREVEEQKDKAHEAALDEELSNEEEQVQETGTQIINVN